MANVSSMFTSDLYPRKNAFPVTSWQFIWYTLILLVGGPMNVIIVYVICKSGNAFRAALFNKYLLSLAVADSLSAFTALPIYLISSLGFRNPGETWGQILCKVNGFVFLFWITEASVFLTTGMSIERFKAITSPLLSTSDNSLLRTRLSIATAWIVSFLIALDNTKGNTYDPNHPSSGHYCKVVIWPSLTGQRVIYSIIFVVTYLFPLLIITYTSFKIRQYVLCQQRLLLRHTTGSNSSYVNQERIIRNRKRSVRSLFLVVASFFVCWTPYRISIFLYSYEPEKYDWNSPSYQVFLLMGFSSSFINCFLYAFQSTDFRRQFQRAFPNLHQRLNSETPTDSTSYDEDSAKQSLMMKQRVYSVLR